MNPIQSLWDRIHRWIDKNLPEFHAYLCPGATDEQFQYFEEITNIYLPEEFKTLYRIHNGSYGKQFFDCCYYLSINDIVSEWVKRKEDLQRFNLNQNLEEEEEETLKIKNQWWNNFWIPFANASTGHQSITLDLAPARGGTYGQIFLWFDDFGSQWMASSLLDYLESFVADLEKGRYDLRRTMLTFKR